MTNMPEIRFKGFTNAWEQRKLGEVAEINPRSVLPDSFEYVDLESVVGTSLISHRTENKDTAPSRAQRLAQRGDIFFQTVRPYQKNNYFFDNYSECFVFSTGYAQLRPQIDGYFLFSKLQEEKFVVQVLDNCTGTSYPAINSSDLSQIIIDMSVSKDEQEKIGNFFHTIDTAITLHKRKLDGLKELKRGYLQQMFPHTGERVPRVRFAGFSGEWEERKLGEVVYEIGTGKSKFIINKESPLNPYPILGSTSIIGFDNTFDYDGDFILTARVGANAGTLYKYNGKVKITDNTVFFKHNESSFLYHLLSHLDLKNLSFGTGQPLIKSSELKNLKVCCPNNSAEQTAIGNFFCNLDGQITAQSQKAEKLKQLKAAYLHKMFV